MFNHILKTILISGLLLLTMGQAALAQQQGEIVRRDIKWLVPDPDAEIDSSIWADSLQGMTVVIRNGDSRSDVLVSGLNWGSNPISFGEADFGQFMAMSKDWMEWVLFDQPFAGGHEASIIVPFTSQLDNNGDFQQVEWYFTIAIFDNRSCLTAASASVRAAQAAARRIHRCTPKNRIVQQWQVLAGLQDQGNTSSSSGNNTLLLNTPNGDEADAAPVAFNSFWRIGQTLMGLVAEGSSRKLYFVDANTGRAGPLFFDGQYRSNSNRYEGTAYRYIEGCPAQAYALQSPAISRLDQVVLSGNEPQINAECRVVGNQFRQYTVRFSHRP